MVLEDNSSGIKCDLMFSTRTVPIQEARQTYGLVLVGLWMPRDLTNSVVGKGLYRTPTVTC